MDARPVVQADGGPVLALWRYPVKSMLGEEVHESEVTEGGLPGDRAYALVDSADGKVVSAKNPRKWPTLFACRATFVSTPLPAMDVPPVRVTLPTGAVVSSAHPDVDQILTRALGRPVSLEVRTPARAAHAGAGNAPLAADVPVAEEYWPDMDGLDYRDTVTDVALREGTFFDSAIVHLLTTGTLARLQALYPQGTFAPQRFRPNVVVATGTERNDFVENGWIGRTLAIGDAVRLNVTGPCQRCVMTTLAQGDLPRDPGILRTAARHNEVNVGVYAAVARGGTIRVGDLVRLL